MTTIIKHISYIFLNFGVEFDCTIEMAEYKSHIQQENILTTTQESCNILVDLLLQYGVKHAIVSPGSRNAPIIIALSRCKDIKKYTIVDERSAAFVAIGIAQQNNEPVAIVCTSGSAVLNYAPAISEAFYQQLPIIVISADRPIEWLDQNDSQTIKQYGILQNIVKNSYDIPANFTDKSEQWYCNRSINEALQVATTLPKGPVHINVQLREPLYERKPLFTPSASKECFKEFSKIINSNKKVLVLASMHSHCQELTDKLNALSGKNIVVLSEIIANNNGEKIFHNIDRLFTEISKEDWNSLKPDLLITFGGAPVSRLAKTRLRELSDIDHWRIGIDNGIIDTMQNITHRIETSPMEFFTSIELENNVESTYFAEWQNLSIKANTSHHTFIENCDWSDLKAMSIIMKNLPSENLNLQISNGSSIRYADIIGVVPTFNGTVHCNRGVSGIDGSTSTALGASIANINATTLFITGDMSFSYDLNGLASQYNSERLKIIVLCNGGGGIFRFLNGPSDLPEFEEYFEVHKDIPTDKYAYAFGFEHLTANDEQSLQESLAELLNNNKPTILAVHTNNKISASTLKSYYNRNK